MPVAMPVVLRAKCVVVGDSAVGKSALTQVFHSDGTHFPKAYSMTVGVELCVKSVNIPDTSNSVELYIYDSAGKEMFSDYVQQMWDSPSLAMVVCDVTNEKSLSSSMKWLERVKAKAGRDINDMIITEAHSMQAMQDASSEEDDEPPEKMPAYLLAIIENATVVMARHQWQASSQAVLVGNKTDLDTRRVVTAAMTQKAASGMEVEYFECSAKERESVEAPFYYLANTFYKQYQEKVVMTESICE